MLPRAPRRAAPLGRPRVLEALLHACAIGDSQAIDESVPKVARRCQVVPERARLARELLRLRDEGQLSRFLVAVGILAPLPHAVGACGVRRASKLPG